LSKALSVEAILEAFDGSAFEATQLRRAILQETRSINPAHSVFISIDQFYCDVELVALSLNMGNKSRSGLRQHLLQIWQPLAAEIAAAKRQSLH
jgi:hypothetical protein